MTTQELETLADAIAVADELAVRLRELLENVSVERRKCRLCATMLYFVRFRNDPAVRALTAEGIDHAGECTGLRARLTAKQTPLFDVAPDALEPKR